MRNMLLCFVLWLVGWMMQNGTRTHARTFRLYGRSQSSGDEIGGHGTWRQAGRPVPEIRFYQAGRLQTQVQVEERERSINSGVEALIRTSTSPSPMASSPPSLLLLL